MVVSITSRAWSISPPSTAMTIPTTIADAARAPAAMVIGTLNRFQWR
jgi:hypothetical protein